ncbi:thrombospondin type-1 domain-containing protein 8 [Paroedura picta]|uniref:thrombospondin type-1 domain-containing protein 8 n=1 Tax=Paroedura picta TaxID=143630 RepID=UPI004056D4C4
MLAADWLLSRGVAMATTSLVQACCSKRVPSSRSGPFSVPELMMGLLATWLLSTSSLWLLSSHSSSSLQVDLGGMRVHWSSWQPWICMCNLHKQARLRYLVTWAANLTVPVETRGFWEERPCSLQECLTCRPEECQGGSERSGWFPPPESFPLTDDSYDSEIPLPPSLDPESYDSLPVLDDMGEE